MSSSAISKNVALKHSLLTEVLSPLVLGGTLVPMAPVGAVRALALVEPSDDTPLLEPQSLLMLARVRVARALAPVDRLDIISPAEWAMTAAYNDLLQATHPDYRNALRRSGPKKLLESNTVLLAHVAPPQTIGEGLSRHTLFSRFFEAARTDVRLEWWTGSATFLGTTPSKRLAMWPELRNVREQKNVRTIMDLAKETSQVDADAFEATVREFLARTPLTDLATCDRTQAPFAWTQETISFVGSRAGCTLAVRAMAKRPPEAVDAALGSATAKLYRPDGTLVDQSVMPALQAIGSLLAERALARAWRSVEEGSARGAPGAAAQMARMLGARRVIEWLTAHPQMMPARTSDLLLEALSHETSRK